MKEEDSRTSISVGKPMISSRLPKAFSQPKHLTNKKLQESHQDLSAVNEFKNVKKLLSPLKQPTSKNSAFHKAINKLAFFPNLLNHTPSNSVQIDLLVQAIVRLDEMITISILKSSYRSGVVKKSLHAPTLRLYATKEVPISTFAMRQRLIEIIKSWQKIQKGARYLVEVNSSFWNSPEGCVTIMMEYMAGDSLARLCESIGAIPERIIRGISKRVLTGLSYHHKKIGPHGGLDMNHIMLTRYGKAKLGLGLSTRLNLREDMTIKKTFSISDDVFDFGATLIAASLGCQDWANEFISSSGDCCLYHTAISCRELPFLSRISRSFAMFLCFSTQYNEEKRASLNDLLSHEWMKSEDINGIDINIMDLLGMTVASNGREYNLNAERQLNMICESLKVVLSGNFNSNKLDVENLKELALELGITLEALKSRFKNISDIA